MERQYFYLASLELHIHVEEHDRMCHCDTYLYTIYLKDKSKDSTIFPRWGLFSWNPMSHVFKTQI